MARCRSALTSTCRSQSSTASVSNGIERSVTFHASALREDALAIVVEAVFIFLQPGGATSHGQVQVATGMAQQLSKSFDTGKAIAFTISSAQGRPATVADKQSTR